MKKNLLLLLFAGLFSVSAQDRLKLFLPEAIYATPGIEMNVYFDNIVRTITPEHYVFDVDCRKGKNLTRCWRFTPKDSDVGEYTWKIRIFDDAGLVAQGETRLVVIPRNAGENRKISILMIGDSLTNGLSYPPHVHKLFQNPGNPKLRMVGSYHLAGVPVKPDGPANEGYAGWKWGTFLTQWKPLPSKSGSSGKPLSPYDYSMKLHYARSPFLFEKNGRPELDFQAYLDKYNAGKAPDFITIMLGTNNIMLSSDESFSKDCETAFRDMDTLLAAIRKAAPDAVIGVGFPPPPSRSQDGFGQMNGCGTTRWQAKKNTHAYMFSLAEKIRKQNPYRIHLIPTFLNIDCENNYPMRTEAVNQRNPDKIQRHIQNVHPAKTGYQQIGDTFYCWLKYQLNQK